MTNEMMVRGAKSAKIGKTLTGYLILSADGGRVGGRLTDWEHGPPLKITDHDFKNFFKIW